jgi:membrane-bound metal-dependent hydrolase YbcI (DUF457 family)
MPSPIAHALTGVLTSWVADLSPGSSNRDGRASSAARPLGGFALTCAVLAAIPDIDLLFSGHRTITHSIGAVTFVALAGAIAGALAGRPAARVAVICAVAYASHIFLDWLAVDRTPPRGVQALWPFDQHWYISGWNLFKATERRHVFTPAAIKQNAAAIAQELALLAPLLAIAWVARRRARRNPADHQQDASSASSFADIRVRGGQ